MLRVVIIVGQAICDILAAMLAAAKAAGNTEQQRKILRAQKYLGCRNVRKRRSNL
jgi:hypothetical protein